MLLIVKSMVMIASIKKRVSHLFESSFYSCNQEASTPSLIAQIEKY